jgi:cytochrome c553
LVTVKDDFLMRKSYLKIAGLILVSSTSFAAEVKPDAFATSTQTRHIQILAASCAACHGTNGNSVGGTPVLAGLDKSRFVSRMLTFRSAVPASAVMTRHAKGLMPEEIEQLGEYFSKQPRVQSAALHPKE